LRVAVVGGGMAGLGAAWALEGARRGGAALEWDLYEREPRLGGKVLTVRHDGFVVEGGPDSALAEKPWPIRLAHELGIGDRLLDANEDVRRSFVLWRGRLHELPEGLVLTVPTRLLPFALSRLLSWRGKARVGLDLVLPRGAVARAFRDGRAAADPGLDESLAAFVRRRLGDEVLERIAEPIVAGVHAGDPERMSLRATFPLFLELEARHRSAVLGMVARRRARQRAAPRPAATGGQPRSYFYSFAGGLQDLVEALVAALPAARLHAGLGVARLAPGGEAGAPPGGRYALTLDDGRLTVVDAVVVATPAFAAAGLLRPLVPAAASLLDRIGYVTTATVSLAWRAADVPHDLRGFGYVVPRVERRPVMATTWSSSKFAGRAPAGHVLLRSFLGRAGAEGPAELDDEEMVGVVRRELRETMGVAAPPLFAHVFRWPRGMPQYEVGHLGLVARVEAEVARLPGLALAGGAYHGIGIGDCLREGAAAARRVLEAAGAVASGDGAGG